jgi:hypothetical protein
MCRTGAVSNYQTAVACGQTRRHRLDSREARNPFVLSVTTLRFLPLAQAFDANISSRGLTTNPAY